MCNMPGPAVTRARLCECCDRCSVTVTWSMVTGTFPSPMVWWLCGVLSKMPCSPYWVLSEPVWGSPRLSPASPGSPCPQPEAQLVGAGSPGLRGQKAGAWVSRSWPGISWPCQPGGAGLLGLVEARGLAGLGCSTRQAQGQSAGGTCGLWVLRTHWLSPPLLLCALRPQVREPMGSCSPRLSFRRDRGARCPGLSPPPWGASHSCGQPSPELLQLVRHRGDRSQAA